MASSIQPIRDSHARIRVAPPDLVFTDWGLRDRPVSSAVALTLGAGLGWLAGGATQSAIIGVGVAAALAVTLWRTWLPVTYELGSRGITQSVLGWRRRIPWTAIRHFEMRRDGVLLFPMAVVTRVSSLRGLYLHWGERSAEVQAQLEFYLHSWHPAPRTSDVKEAPPVDQGQTPSGQA